VRVRRVYAIRDGELVELTRSVSEVDAPAVHQDSFKDGLKHPVTGETVYCHSRWNEINRERGLRVVGNDWVGDGPPKNDIKDRITEERVMDAIEKSISIETDPDKRREKRYREERELEAYYGRKHDTIKNIIQIRELRR
jgi:hypothetical protein